MKMSNVEQLTKLIQDAVNGCSKNWAETIAIYLLNRGDYLYGKRELKFDMTERITNKDVLNNWKGLDLSDAPDYAQMYDKLGVYEDMDENGMLKKFIDIGEEHYEN
jgi:hypothetical protein